MGPLVSPHLAAQQRRLQSQKAVDLRVASPPDVAQPVVGAKGD